VPPSSGAAYEPMLAPGFDAEALQDLAAAGVGKYIGMFTPTSVAAQSDGSNIYTFAANQNGPICLQGGPYAASAKDNGSDDLLIYLQGGGACWTANCAANTQAAPGILPIGWTDQNVKDNPLGSYNIVYLAYCDGSVFSGDNELADPKNGAPNGVRYHHGLENLTAGLDLAKKLFPNPAKIVLAGSSAGGYGTIMGTVVTRLEFPHTRLYVINDAGVGLASPAVFQAATTEWNVLQFIPASCTECQNGEFTPLIGWGLQHDATLKVGAFSSYEDAVIGGAYLGLSDPTSRRCCSRKRAKCTTRFPRASSASSWKAAPTPLCLLDSTPWK
jgi:Pectinacetylesterase